MGIFLIFVSGILTLETKRHGPGPGKVLDLNTTRVFMDDREKIILPPKYYLDYFLFLLTFVEEKSGHCLGEEDVEFIRLFRDLSEDAQCLAVRMANRKGEFFRLDKLQYEEIRHYDEALDELSAWQFITLEDLHYPDIFNLFTKNELDSLFPAKGLKPLYKNEVLDKLMSEACEEDYAFLCSSYRVIRFLIQDQVEYLKLLFFGHYKGMMTEFVIRDIGNVKLENLDHHEFTSWFGSREEALAVFHLSKWKSIIRQSQDLFTPEELGELLAKVPWEDYLRHEGARKTGDRLMLLLGEYFERSSLLKEAIRYYGMANKHPARERLIRINEKLGEQEKAQATALEILENPHNASEQLFAKDFLAKRGVKTYRSTTVRIKSSPEISVEAAAPGRVEEKAIAHFVEQGYSGIHSENYLWRGLFGLVFWEELFDSNYASFHHPLQRTPSDLFNREFYRKRKDSLKARVNRLRSKKAFTRHLEEMYSAKENISNPLVGWHDSLLTSLKVSVEHLPLKGIKAVLLEMAKNVKDNSAGFPDLFIWTDSDYHFYEIKSPNDHLSSQQLFWIDFFNHHGIKADILRVLYR